jgi:hypothetical protein
MTVVQGIHARCALRGLMNHAQDAVTIGLIEIEVLIEV